MGLTVRETGSSDFTPAPAGTHTAVCVQVIDIGTQYSQYYQTSKPKVLLGWELPDELNDQGEPFLVWKRYTASLHENSRLRHDLSAWRGRDFTADELDGFELKNVLGKACMVNITHRADGSKTYADVGSVMKLPKSIGTPDYSSELVLFDIDSPDWRVFSGFRESLQATIMAADEMKGKAPPNAPNGTPLEDDGETHEPMDDDDIPF